MIEFDNVSMSYTDDVPALKDVTLHIAPGEFVFIVGDSGAGKSTFIKLMTKELEPTEGDIYIDGENTRGILHKDVPRFRRKLGVVFQNFRLLKDRNVYENVAFAMRVVGAKARSIRKKVPLMIAMVGLAAKYTSMPTEISGGEQQRVAIARALVNDPKILLADEPTGNLDPQNAWDIMKLLKEISDRGTTVVVVTHNINMVQTLGGRVITINRGRIVSDTKEGGMLEYEP